MNIFIGRCHMRSQVGPLLFGKVYMGDLARHFKRQALRNRS